MNSAAGTTPNHQPAPGDADPVLAEIVRSGFVEGRHRGRLVLLAADGSVQLAVGDVRAPILPRSANKPMQAAGLLDAGLELSRRELAPPPAPPPGRPPPRDRVPQDPPH